MIHVVRGSSDEHFFLKSIGCDQKEVTGALARIGSWSKGEPFRQKSDYSGLKGVERKDTIRESARLDHEDKREKRHKLGGLW